MPLPIQFTRLLAEFPRPAAVAASGPAPWAIAAFDPATDAAAVTALATACRAEAGPHAGHFLPAGVLAECTGRPGRGVRAWLAWPPAARAETAAAPPAAACSTAAALGLVTLVVVPATPPRASIGWLLVHPAARRRGVAGALVAVAVDAARGAGAERVTADTLPTWPAAAAFWRAAGFRAGRSATDG